MAEKKFIVYLKTVALYLAFFTNGVIISIVGPTILELQCSLDVSYDQIIRILPTRACGYVIGSFLVGILYDKFNPLLTIMMTLTVSGIATLLFPWAGSVMALFAAAFFSNLGCGMIESTCNVFLLYMWGKESQPWMQALHFAFGCGGLVAPLLASPFLTAGEAPIEGLAVNATLVAAQSCKPEDVRIHIPYGIVGVYAIVVAILFLYLYCCHGQTEEHPSRVAKAAVMATEDEKDLVWTRRIVIVSAALFMFTYLGFEVGMGSFITSFAVMSDNHLSKQVGAYMTSVYWFMYTIFKLVAVGFIDKIGSHNNIVIELMILIVANAFLVPFGNTITWCLWVGVVLVGIGVSTIWAAMFGFLENYFLITSKMAAFLTVSGVFGEVVYPVLMGYAIELHPQIFMWIIFVCTVFCCTFFAICSYLCRTRLCVVRDKQASVSVVRIPCRGRNMTGGHFVLTIWCMIDLVTGVQFSRSFYETSSSMVNWDTQFQPGGPGRAFFKRSSYATSGHLGDHHFGPPDIGLPAHMEHTHSGPHFEGPSIHRDSYDSFEKDSQTFATNLRNNILSHLTASDPLKSHRTRHNYGPRQLPFRGLNDPLGRRHNVYRDRIRSASRPQPKQSSYSYNVQSAFKTTNNNGHERRSGMINDNGKLKQWSSGPRHSEPDSMMAQEHRRLEVPEAHGAPFPKFPKFPAFPEFPKFPTNFYA
ncbi:Major facilitator superfamily domain-containing protein 4A [Halotydeus destructor]|nr:Major facilitator superfamily domain-containing protein 4A [Halotydeus destructor]